MGLHILRPVLSIKKIQDAEQVLGANILTETSVHLHSDRLDLKLNINVCACSACIELISITSPRDHFAVIYIVFHQMKEYSRVVTWKL